MHAIRKATEADLKRLTEIYNQAINAGYCTCDMDLFSYEERIPWFREHLNERFPIFVYERDRTILGYSYISPYRKWRKALSKVCEISYYIDMDYRRQGIGSTLMEYTLEKARENGFTMAIAVSLSCNEASIGLLRKYGFQQWGMLPDAAELKCGVHSQLYYGKKL